MLELEASDVVRVFVQAPVLVKIVARDGLLVHSNFAYGLGHGALIGQPAELAVQEQDRERFLHVLRRARLGEQAHFVVRMLAEEEPTGLLMAGEATPVRSEGGRVEQVLVVAMDCDRLARLARDADAEVGGDGRTRGEWFSELGARVYTLLRSRKGKALTAEQIARELGESITGDLRPVLREYVSRGVIEGGQGRPYRCA